MKYYYSVLKSLKAVFGSVFLIMATQLIAAELPSVDGNACSKKNVVVYFKSTSASRTKYGYNSFTSTTPPKKFLRWDITENASPYVINPGNTGGMFAIGTACPGQVVFEGDFSWHTGSVTAKFFQSGDPIFSGDGDDSYTSDICNAIPPDSCSDSFYASLPVGQCSRPELEISSGVTVTGASITFIPDTSVLLGQSKIWSTNWDEFPSQSISGNTWFSDFMCGGGKMLDIERTADYLRQRTPGSATYGEQTNQLSNEFTTELLEAVTRSDLTKCSEPDWGAGKEYTVNSCADVPVKLSAYRNLSSDELTIEVRKLKFYFDLYREPDTDYLITWEIEQKYEDGSQPTRSWNSEFLPSNQSPTVHELQPPLVDGSLRVINYHAIPLKKVCGDCNASSSAGMGITELASADLTIDLGIASFDRFVGQLKLHEFTLTTNSTTPASLFFAGNTNYADIKLTGLSLRQIKVPQALIDITTNSLSDYQIAFYSSATVLTNVGSLYLTNGTPPYVFWRIFVPTNGTPTNNLRITETRYGKVYTNDYTFLSNTWTFVSGNGLRKETKETIWTNSNSLRLETKVIYDSANQAVYKQIEKYQDFPWGSSIIERTIDPEGAALKTFWYYNYANPSSLEYGLLNQVTYSTGYWEKYSYDSLKRLIHTYSPFVNSWTNNLSGSRDTENNYSTNYIAGSGDDGTREPFLPRRMHKSIQNSDAGMSYNIVLEGEIQEIESPLASGAWADTNNLVTVKKWYTHGINKGKLFSVLHSNGIKDVYFYDLNSTNLLDATFRTNIVISGIPELSTSTNIVAGTKTVTLVGASGQIFFTKIYDVASGYLIGQEINSNFDELNRPQRITYLDETFIDQSYDCCSISVLTNREGTVFTYDYDDLKRRTVETTWVSAFLSLSTIRKYDPLGNTLSVTRQGTNGTSMTLESTGYDLAGRAYALTNGAGAITIYTNILDANGRTISTNTYASGSTNSATEIVSKARDGALLTTKGSAVHPFTTGYAYSSGLLRAQTTKLDDTGSLTLEYKIQYFDPLGRNTQVSSLVGSATTGNHYFNYNAKNQLTKEIAFDSVRRLYTYDGLGLIQYTAIDMDRDDLIDLDGLDRITYTTNDVVQSHGYTVFRTRTYAWLTESSSTSNLLFCVESSVDGTCSWRTIFDESGNQSITNKTYRRYPGHGYVILTETAPDGSSTVTTNLHGRPISTGRFDATGVLLEGTSFGYNSHNLPYQSIDFRNGMRIYNYDSADRIASVTTPPSGNGHSPQTTTLEYDVRGRVWRTIFPDGGSVTNYYYPSGELKLTYGTKTYATAYSYNVQGRIRTMTNWGNFSASIDPRVTAWGYNIYNGLVSAKTNAGANIPTKFVYGSSSGNTRGRLSSRISGRNVTTSYAYNNAGELASIAYNNGSPGVSFTYDRLGRMRTAVHNNNTVTYSYTAMGLKTSEAYSGTGTLGANGGLIITNTYDSLFRPDSVYIDSKKSETLNAYGYDSTSRLTNVSDNVYSAAYSYAPNSHLIESVISKENSDVRLASFRSYDKLNRLMSVSAANFTQNLRYNNADQRTRAYLNDGSYWAYQYDSLGQVISAKKYWNDNTPVAGQQFEYSFDDIGNRAQTRTGGDENGAGLRAASYSPTIQNTYTSREVPGSVDTFGLANAAATVTVNGQSTYRKGEYYHTVISVANTNSLAYPEINTTAILSTSLTVTNYVFVPQTPELFFYDADGNLTSDGHWTNLWNVENRITQMESLSSAPAASKRRLQFEYDFLGRRIRKKVFTWSIATSAYATTPISDIKFVYDGWNLLAELNATNNAVLRSYLWGLDLSGTLKGAGGVGGLLGVKPAGAAIHFAAYDGNGNVVGLVDGSTGEISAWYEYGPFGEPIRVSGAMAKLNPFRFSTKYTDDESGFLYYGYRYYNPETGRWLNPDPIGENGGLNLYAYVGNNPVNRIDPYGLAWSDYNPLNVLSPDTYRGLFPGVYNQYLNWNLDKYAQSRGYKYGYEDALRTLDERLGDEMSIRRSQARSIADAANLASDLANTYVTAATMATPTSRGARCLSEGAAGVFDAMFAGGNASRGFKSFDALKRYLGSPGEGNAWHHIVEQSKEGIFGARAIHNIDNVIPIPEALNAKLNNIYSSIAPDITGSTTLTIRKWLETKTLQQNYQFGRAALELVEAGIW